MKKLSLSVDFDQYHVDIPYYVFEGKQGGPTFFLSGGMHGDEVNGVMIVSKFLEWFEKEAIEQRMFGKLYVIPVLNVSGFAHRKRRVCEDNRDPNRAFAYNGVPKSFSEAIAKELTNNIFQHCNFGIDIHDAGDRDVLLPHSRFHACNDLYCDVNTRKMAKLFGSEIAIERKGKKGMLAIEMYRKFGIPVLTLEVGGNQRLYTKYYAKTIQGIKNILIAYGLFSGDLVLGDQSSVILSERYAIKSIYPCVVDLSVDLYDVVKVGMSIGTAFYPLEQKLVEIISPFSGVVFSICKANQIIPDSTIVSFLVDNDYDLNGNLDADSYLFVQKKFM